jgi:hypothetical protein
MSCSNFLISETLFRNFMDVQFEFRLSKMLQQTDT